MKPETTGNKGATWPAVLLSLCILALAGCQGGAAKREVYAEYIVPPRVVADVSSLERMRIDAPEVAVNGSYPGKPQELSVLFEESLRERLDAKISRERFFEVADEIYDNDQGLTRIRQIMLVQPPRLRRQTGRRGQIRAYQGQGRGQPGAPGGRGHHRHPAGHAALRGPVFRRQVAHALRRG